MLLKLVPHLVVYCKSNDICSGASSREPGKADGPTCHPPHPKLVWMIRNRFYCYVTKPKRYNLVWSKLNPANQKLE